MDDSSRLVLGLDTGGTYTDGVLLDYTSRSVLATHKCLTTRWDLAQGIERVIEGIQIEDPGAVALVSVSTTLATNAIAEGKGKRVALLLIGYDPELVASFHLEPRFATPHFEYIAGGHDLFGQMKEALDLPRVRAYVEQIQSEVDAFAVSSYFSPLNPEHELQAYEAISAVSDLPVVLGHQLSTRLNSIERATTAALNGSLLAVLQDFILAVRQAMERRGIQAPLMVVRGDGTLMSAEFAVRTPMETIHSGPAASAIGGRFLSGRDDALVIDIGGTTTDLALIEAGEVKAGDRGASVAGYQTSVRAANLLSIGLGGDSHIRLDRENEILIGPERVVPLAYLAAQYKEIGRYLEQLAERPPGLVTPDSLEVWFLVREPRDRSKIKSARGKELLELLARSPQPLPLLLEELGLLHTVQIGAGELLRREIIGKASLTPTDLLHVDGRFAPWNAEASAHALAVFCRLLKRDAGEVAGFVWARMNRTIIQAIVAFLSGLAPDPESLDENKFARWFIDNALEGAHPNLETRLRLRQPIIGIGAPADIFLNQVAECLHSELLLPEHFPVANAVGAVAGSVMASEEILIYPRLSSSGLDIVSYFVRDGDGRSEFATLEDARRHARTHSQEQALRAALDSGADDPQVVVVEIADGLDSYRIRARAIGNPRLSKQQMR